MIEIFLLSAIQGITEFIPVSSSSHLVIASNFLNFTNQSLSIDVSLHIGSFFAVIFYFKDDIFDFIKNKDLFIKIIISSIPVIIAGYLFVKFNFIDQLRNLEVIGWMTIIFGIIMYFSDKLRQTKNIESNFSFKSAIIIGFLQILSLVPGVSRSGITITAARFLNFKRLDSAKISFLLSIPTLGAVSVYGISNLINSDDLEFSMINLLAIIFAFIFSYFTIKYFLKYIKQFSLKIFVIYRIFIGIVILFLIYL